MGLFTKIFGRRPNKADGGGIFSSLTAYSPAFTSWGGQLYESDLIRASIECLAVHSSKLQIRFAGPARSPLKTRLEKAPNSWQTWSQFMARLRTILEIQTTAFIVPVYDELGARIGIYPVLPSSCTLVDVRGEPWLKYTFTTGEVAALPMSECCVLTKFQYKDDFMGSGNGALNDTLDVIHMQSQGIREGIKNSATFRFMAEMSNATSDKDIAKERQRFNEYNLRGESGGILLFKNTMKNVKQIDQKPYLVDADQMKLIKANVFNYFGINEKILQSSCYGDEYLAFYESKIEPFGIQLSETLTKMIFTLTEQGFGNQVYCTANRMQYMSNKDKLQVSSEMLDRGVMNIDEIREIWNLDPIPDGKGKAYVIRGEYKNTEEVQPNAQQPVEQPDDSAADQ
ncbi:MAG: phage portal protein [Clostridia bacterium]|nr:phage portal protein [Clostridia bacterium]